MNPCSVEHVQLTAADLFRAMSTVPGAAPRLATVVPAALALLSSRTPAWAHMHVARESTASALLNLIHSALRPDIRIKHPGLLDAVIAPLATSAGAQTLLMSARQGTTELTSKSAACLYWVVVHQRGDVAFLTREVVQVRCRRNSANGVRTVCPQG
jgi:hypothetical protein